MDWYTGILEIIDTRSFTSLWYWVLVAVTWSSTSHYTLGVPFDMVIRARRHEEGPPQTDLEHLVEIYCNRFIHIMDLSGPWIVGFGFFLLTCLGLLGFYYKLELAQALFLLAAPLSLVAGMSIRAARRLQANPLQGAELRMHMARLRFVNQLIGLAAIFVTAFWGMWHNLNATVL